MPSPTLWHSTCRRMNLTLALIDSSDVVCNSLTPTLDFTSFLASEEIWHSFLVLGRDSTGCTAALAQANERPFWRLTPWNVTILPSHFRIGCVTPRLKTTVGIATNIRRPVDMLLCVVRLGNIPLLTRPSARGRGYISPVKSAFTNETILSVADCSELTCACAIGCA
jgi:hypothetical protein